MFFWFFSSIFFLFAICFGLFFVISNALIPGFSETQQQFVYVLELAEANGKDSDQLISQAWDYSLAAMLCVFFLFAHCFFNCFPAGGLASGVSEAASSECRNQGCDEEGGEAMM